MTDLRINFNEEMVGAGHPAKADTLNRLAVVEHNNDGTHKAFMTLSPSGGDDTATIQAAINTGKAIVFSQGTYYANNLTVSTAYQKFYGLGKVIIQKNANGPIVTVTAEKVTFENIMFYGDASSPVYTGDNVYATGNHFSMINCGSRWAYGRAVKATGAHTQIIGTNDIYQTADATATGYDIEIGVSGTATLYHKLIGIYTSQATGGILLVETGNVALLGGQFGKLYIDKGTASAGNHGPYVVGCRVNGITTVDQASTMFSANSFSDDVTIAAGVSGVRWDVSNALMGGKTLTNGSPINTSVIYASGDSYKFGDSSSPAHRFISDGTFQAAASIRIKNNAPIYFRNAADTAWVQALIYGLNDDLFLGTNDGANFTMVGSGTGGVYLTVGGTSIVQAYASGIRPQTDNTYDSGIGAQRWANIYATNLKPGAGTVTWTSGAGTPEGAVTAAAGSLYTRTDGGVGTTLYVKETGAGNTGWAAK